uniref:ATP-dependent RNA helicase n=1 Tax=Dermatophagoides pteronyssinus TaxID=6956 RepID=A0A6P6YC37_DERPT|nr:ATP-dependent RNA helicase MSS116, mitochondrial-like [Dermatophagoides pteronyssinus]
MTGSGGLSIDKQLRLIKKNAHFIVATTGRFIDIIDTVSEQENSHTETLKQKLSQALNVRILNLTSRVKQKKRYETIESFFKEKCKKILISTDLAARGLDFRDISCVFHLQFSQSCILCRILKVL